MTLLNRLYLSIRNKLKINGPHKVKISNSAKLRNCKISIQGEQNQLTIGDNVRLRDVSIELDGADCELSIEDDCVIGGNTYLSVRESGTRLTIGKNCMFSRNIKIMTSDGHNILKNGVRINPAKSIRIEDNVWLADNVTVLKGVTLETGCLVGINSTVTKDVAAHQIAVGNPAKPVAEDVKWQTKLTY